MAAAAATAAALTLLWLDDPSGRWCNSRFAAGSCDLEMQQHGHEGEGEGDELWLAEGQQPGWRMPSAPEGGAATGAGRHEGRHCACGAAATRSNGGDL